MSDFRLNSLFFEHPKTLELTQRFSYQGVLSLLRIWAWTARNCPTGDWRMEARKLAPIAGIWLEGPDDPCAEEFCRGLVEIGFLEECSGQYSLHDWSDHQPWCVAAPDRAEKARNAAKKRWGNAPSNARGNANGNAPSPSPSPSPPESSSPSEKNPPLREDKLGAAASPPSDPVVASIECVSGVYDLVQSQIDKWAATYPAVDVPVEIGKAVAWLDANPTRRKTARGMPRFLVNWLSRVQDRGGSNGRSPFRGGLTANERAEELARWKDGPLPTDPRAWGEHGRRSIENARRLIERMGVKGEKG